MISDIDAIKQAISIPAYFKRFIDPKINLEEPTIAANGQMYRAGLICCPFHKEDTPSFSYDSRRKIWRCFGKCKVGGDVIRLHQVNKHIATRDDAIDSLLQLLHLGARHIDFHEPTVYYDRKDADLRVLENRAYALAKTKEDWIELDYIMTKFQRREDMLADLDEFIRARCPAR